MRAAREAGPRDNISAMRAADQNALRDACSAWQGGRDEGSSRLRAAARVLTGLPHYFGADFIKEQEEAARRDAVSLEHARILLDAVAASQPRDAAAWRGDDRTVEADLAGRGLTSKPQDDDILEALATGEIVMPLWGVSLDRTIAESYGRRFLFLISGPFRGVAAWEASGEKREEQEIITGGRYEVLDVASSEHENSTVVRLREVATILPSDARGS